MWLLKLKYDKSVDHAIPPKLLQTGSQIETDDLQLIYKGDVDKMLLKFELIDKKSQHSETFDFGLRYWKSSQYDGQSSGAYIFRPASAATTPETYSELHIDESYYFDEWRHA